MFLNLRCARSVDWRSLISEDSEMASDWSCEVNPRRTSPSCPRADQCHCCYVARHRSSLHSNHTREKRRKIFEQMNGLFEHNHLVEHTFHSGYSLVEGLDTNVGWHTRTSLEKVSVIGFMNTHHFFEYIFVFNAFHSSWVSNQIVSFDMCLLSTM